MRSHGAQAVSSVPTSQSAYKACFSDRISSYVAYGSMFFYGGAMLLLLLWICSSHVPSFRGIETNVIFGIDKLLRNLPLYGDPTQPPFDIEQYTPLYYYAVATVARLLGFHSGDAYHITATARFLSFLCLFSTLFFTFLLLRKFQLTRLQALATCSFVLIATSPWPILARPDGMLSMCLMAMTYFTVTAVESSQSSAIDWRFILAALCAVGAILIKQNGVIGIVIIASFYTLRRDWRHVATLALLALPLLVTSLNQDASRMIISNIIDGIRNGVNLSRAIEKAYVPFWSQMAVLVALFANAAVTSFKKSSHPGHTFLVISAISHFVLATVMALKDGAAIHYYNDFIALASIVVAIDLKRMLSTRPVEGGVSLLVVGAIYLLVFLTGWSANQFYTYFLMKRGDYFEARMPVADFLRHNLSHIPITFFISTDPVLSLLVPSKSLLPQMELATIAYSQGQIDYTELARLVKQGKVPYLVVRLGETPGTLLGIDLTIFKHHLDIAKWSIYIYAPLTGSAPSR